MAEPDKTKPVLLMRVTDEGEVMATSPGGTVRFMGWWKGLALAFRALREGWDVVVDE